MFGWLKKRVLKSIIKDITKQLPKYKEMALMFIEQHSDEVLAKVKEAIIEIVEAEYAKYINNKGK